MNHTSRPKVSLSDQTYSLPSEKTFYQVTYLSNVSLVFLTQQNVCNLSRLERIKNLMVAHFDIPLKAVSEVLLLDVDSARIVKEDADLICRRYYLALLKSGQELPLDEEELEDEPLITHPLFHRISPIINVKERKQYEMGRVEVLEPVKTMKKKCGFVCPFIGCNMIFRRPWDLMAHFRINARPYQCDKCQKTFRRKVILTQHSKKCSRPEEEEKDAVKLENQEKPRALSLVSLTTSSTPNGGTLLVQSQNQGEMKLYEGLHALNFKRKDQISHKREQETKRPEIQQIEKNQKALSLIALQHQPILVDVILEMWSRILETALILKKEYGIESSELNFT